MFLRFYAGQGVEEKAKRFSDIVLKSGKSVSPAQVQGFFMFFKDNPDDVLGNAHRMQELL